MADLAVIYGKCSKFVTKEENLVRYAAFSDIHGNPIALDAVLADIERQGGVEGYLVLGDLVAQGYDSVGVLERLAALPNASFIRGNTDRYVTSREPEWLEDSPERLASRVTAIQCLAWTRGVLSATGWLQWLTALPLEQRLVLPHGTRVLCVHAAPGRDEGVHVDPTTSDGELAELVKGCDAELVMVGHSHYASQRRAGGVHIVNASSVSNPLSTDMRAAYAIIEADASGYEVTLHRATHDLQAVIEAIKASDFYPNPEWLIAWFEGSHSPIWERPGYMGSRVL